MRKIDGERVQAGEYFCGLGFLLLSFSAITTSTFKERL